MGPDEQGRPLRARKERFAREPLEWWRNLRGLVVGSHRRQRSSPRPGRGIVWIGFFLLLAVIAVLASRGLWSGFVADLLNLGPQSAPQASILWQAPCSPGSLCTVNSDGGVLLVSPGGAGDGQGGKPINLAEASDGAVVAIAKLDTPVLAAGYFDPGLGSLPSHRPYGTGDWRVVSVRVKGGAGADAGVAGAGADSAEAGAGGAETGAGGAGAGADGAETGAGGAGAGTDGAETGAGGAGAGAGSPEAAGGEDGDVPSDGRPALLREDVLRLEPVGGEDVVFRSTDAVATAACAWADEAEVVLGLYSLGRSGDPEGVVLAVGAGGETLWSHAVGPDPVHRVVARPGTGFVAAATPSVLALFDSHGNLLWSKSMRTPITDLALQSRGGPAIIAGGSLLVYDRRGNLIWRKQTRAPLRAVACAAERIAVATDTGVAVYDEDGLERWSLACASAPTDVALDPGGDLLATVLDTGTLVLARGPGVPSSEARAPGVASSGARAPGVASSGARAPGVASSGDRAPGVASSGDRGPGVTSSGAGAPGASSPGARASGADLTAARPGGLSRP